MGYHVCVYVKYYQNYEWGHTLGVMVEEESYDGHYSVRGMYCCSLRMMKGKKEGPIDR